MRPLRTDRLMRRNTARDYYLRQPLDPVAAERPDGTAPSAVSVTPRAHPESMSQDHHVGVLLECVKGRSHEGAAL